MDIDGLLKKLSDLDIQEKEAPIEVQEKQDAAIASLDQRFTFAEKMYSTDIVEEITDNVFEMGLLEVEEKSEPPKPIKPKDKKDDFRKLLDKKMMAKLPLPQELIYGRQEMPIMRGFQDHAFARRAAEPRICAAITYPQKKPSTFEETLVELLKHNKYKNVEIQSIKLQETTRIPIYVVAFTHGKQDEQELGYLYIKDYKNNEAAKQKDIIIPIFLNELGIPVAKVLGYDPKKGEFQHRYACSQLTKDGVFLDNIGQTDYSQIVNQLNPQTVVACGKRISELIAKMHILATKNISKLKKKYGLDLEKTDYEKLIHERLLNHLKADEKYKSEFIRAYNRISVLEGGDKIFFSHGDLTTNNIRIGKTLSDYFLIDFELSRRNAFSVEDLEMMTMFTLSLREDDRDDIERHLKGTNRNAYLSGFNSIAKNLDPEFILYPNEFNSQVFVEELKGHLYKIGDQIWTQRRFGESDSRKFRSMWHLKTFLDVLDSETGISDGKKKDILVNYRKKTLELLENSSNIEYLQTLIESKH